MTTSRPKGFTLIELLIVIAIILILIAIALPNFLEAQIRARVVKANSELRSLGTALETYYLDWNFYPFESEVNMAQQSRNERGLLRLTTPNSYISSIPEDPFANSDNFPPSTILTYYGGGCKTTGVLADWGPIYAVWSQGPAQNGARIRATHPNVHPLGGAIISYSPTNGTRSEGSMHLFTGEGAWWGLDTTNSQPRNVCDPAKIKNPSLYVGLVVDSQIYVGQRPPNSFN